MNEFDLKAQSWDDNPMHKERSVAIANGIINSTSLQHLMKGMEFGAGTAILSFLLKDYFWKIVLIDSSEEMIRMTNDKIAASGVKNMKTLLFDLEKEELNNEKFDIIYTQMALHHVTNIEILFDRFHQLLNPQGILFIADLYAEDGSFHGADFNGHKGFDIAELSAILEKHHFSNISHYNCFTIKRKNENETIKEYPVFLLTSKRN